MEENKYEEALERAREIYFNKKYKPNEAALVKETLEELSPELKVSEDEQSRKWILEYLYDGLRKADEQFEGQFKAAIAWLEKEGTLAKSKYIEKQGEKPITIKVDDIDAITDFPTEFEKQVSCFAASIINREYNYDYNLVKWAAKGLLEYAKRELEKQGEKPTTISVDKMVGEFEDFRVISCGRIPSFAELDAYRKGVNDALSKILIKEEKAISVGSKKAEGKLGEMIAASKEPAESGEEDKQLSHKEVTKKSEQEPTNWNDKDEELFTSYSNNVLELWKKEYAEEFINWIKSLKQRLS